MSLTEIARVLITLILVFVTFAVLFPMFIYYAETWWAYWGIVPK